jgi:hypothetical protein
VILAFAADLVRLALHSVYFHVSNVAFEQFGDLSLCVSRTLGKKSKMNFDKRLFLIICCAIVIVSLAPRPFTSNRFCFVHSAHFADSCCSLVYLQLGRDMVVRNPIHHYSDHRNHRCNQKTQATPLHRTRFFVFIVSPFCSRPLELIRLVHDSRRHPCDPLHHRFHH